MGRKGSLSAFQAHLAARLAAAGDQRAAGLLAFQSGGECWLVNLADCGEVVPMTSLAAVPLTKRWFAGIANVRGKLYAVSDFSAFLGLEAAPHNGNSRLLLIGSRFGSNAALLVDRLLGLRNADDLAAATESGARPWASQAFTDKEGQRLNMLDVRELLADQRFMDIGA